MPSHKSREKFDRKLIKLSIKGVLQDVALTNSREKRHNLAVFEFVDVDSLVYLGESNLHGLLKDLKRKDIG